MKDVLLDIRYAARVLWKSPVFSVVALMTLMLAIGINIAVFGIVNAVLLKPLDVSDPQNLYEIRVGSWTNWKSLTTSYPAFRDYRERNTTFTDLAGFYGYCSATLHSGKVAKTVFGYAVTANYFDFLGVHPELGRLIHADDDRGVNSAPFVVLSDQLWRTEFNADSRVIGTTVRLNKDTFTIIGVTPSRFHGTEQFVWPDYYIPAVNYFGSDYLLDRTGHPLTVLGRVKPGITRQQAAKNLSANAIQLAREYPRTDAALPLRLVRPGLYGDTGDVIRSSLYSVSLLGLLVLVAACANLATLFAARAADRSRELAIRIAIGATRWRLVRLLLTEAILLSMFGGVAALAMAKLVLGVMDQQHSPSFLAETPFSGLAMTLGGRFYLMALTLTLVSGLLFGLLPAKNILRSDPLHAMKPGTVDATRLRRFAVRDLLLGAQIVICAVLLTACFVSVRAMLRVLHTSLGFEPHGAFLVEVDLSELEPGADASLEKKKAMIDALRNIAGVKAAGTLSKAPFTGGLRGNPVFLPGTMELTLKNSILSSLALTISQGFFDAAGTELTAGREFSWSDTSEKPLVAIVNRTFARKMWADAPAIGQHFIFRERLREVVGVVQDGKYLDIHEPPQPMLYLPLSQDEHANIVFIVRSLKPAKDMGPLIEQALNTIEPNAPVTVKTCSVALAGQLFPARAATVALGVMGGLASIVAVTGIFGIAMYNVSRRIKELGIRMALGARKTHLMSAAVGRSVMLLALGSTTGVFLASLAGRLLQQIVYEPNPRDPVVLVSVVITMILLGLAASVIPALRAISIDPSKLLREE
jgi:predicted permease